MGKTRKKKSTLPLLDRFFDFALKFRMLLALSFPAKTFEFSGSSESESSGFSSEESESSEGSSASSKSSISC